MHSAERLERSASHSSSGLARLAAIDAALFAALAGSVALVTSLHGAYSVDVWAPAGLVLVALAAALLVAGRRPPGAIAVAAGSLLALGAWSAASPAWGGLPQEGWLKFDQSVLAAAALVVGSCLTIRPGRRELVMSAVLLGVTLHAVVVLARLAVEAHPDEWLQTRFLQGPVGYHNAQGLLFALAIPLALWIGNDERIGVRMLGGSAAGVLAAATLLTQSRGALLGLGVGVAVQLARAHRVSLLLLATALVAAMAGLFALLREVDHALLVGDPDDQARAIVWYVAAAAGAGVALAAAAAVVRARWLARSGRAIAVTLVALLVGAAAAVALHERSELVSAGASLPGLPATENVTESPGETRLATLAPNGRRDAWRVATSMVSENPLIGAGQGQFARRWTEERRLSNLYIRQPHSLELEVLAELGGVGGAFFAAFVAAVAFALARTSRRAIAAAASGTGAVVLVDAAFDWTWSFPGIVIPTLLVAGAAAGSRLVRVPSRIATSIIVVATLALCAAIVLPYLADNRVERARDLLAEPGGGAWSELESARTLDPWNAEALSLEGSIAQHAGNYALAVDRFRAAASNSDRPWLDYFSEASALVRAGRQADARAACERAVAANPAERRLYAGPCAYDEGGNSWPVVQVGVPTGSTAARYSGFYVDKGCSACGLRFAGSELVASTLGAPDSRDTAYGMLDIPPVDPASALLVRDVLRLPAEQRFATHVAVLQVRDAEDRLVYELYVRGDDGAIAFYSPPGGLRTKELNKRTNATLQANGPSRAVEIELVRDGHVTVRVDGTDELSLGGLGGATTGRPSVIRVGILARVGWSPYGPLRIAHADVGASIRR